MLMELNSSRDEERDDQQKTNSNNLKQNKIISNYVMKVNRMLWL